MLFQKVHQLFSQLDQTLNQLTDEQYAMPIAVFDKASLGQHTRHIIEHFQCLILSQKTKHINYDERNRDLEIETNIAACRKAIKQILWTIETEDFELNLVQDYLLESKQLVCIRSSYFREVVFNIDHFVHHQALLKVGLKFIMPNIVLAQNFGYADATIKYKLNVHTQLYT